MTFLIVAMLGAGVVLIASSLDNSSIIDTLRKILDGSKIDWSGMQGQGAQK